MLKAFQGYEQRVASIQEEIIDLDRDIAAEISYLQGRLTEAVEVQARLWQLANIHVCKAPNG